MEEKLIGTGIDCNIFDAVNEMKMILAEKIQNQEISIEEKVDNILRLIDKTFKSQIERVISQQKAHFEKIHLDNQDQKNNTSVISQKLDQLLLS